MKLVKFTQSGKYKNAEGFTYDSSSEIYINPMRVLYAVKYIAKNNFCAEFPESASIVFGDDEHTRVDGTIDEVIAKLEGVK